MDEAVFKSWKLYHKPQHHAYRRSLYDSGEWSLVKIGVLVIVLEIVWTIIVVALVFGLLYLFRFWRGSWKWPWTWNADLHNSTIESNDSTETSAGIISVRSSFAQSRGSQALESQDDGDLPLPRLQHEKICPGERCPSFGPRTDKKVMFPFSNLLMQPADIELEYYSFDNVRWFANHLDYHKLVASAGDDFGLLFQVRLAV